MQAETFENLSNICAQLNELTSQSDFAGFYIAFNENGESIIGPELVAYDSENDDHEVTLDACRNRLLRDALEFCSALFPDEAFRQQLRSQGDRFRNLVAEAEQAASER